MHLSPCGGFRQRGGRGEKLRGERRAAGFEQRGGGDGQRALIALVHLGDALEQLGGLQRLRREGHVAEVRERSLLASGAVRRAHRADARDGRAAVLCGVPVAEVRLRVVRAEDRVREERGRQSAAHTRNTCSFETSKLTN